MALCGHVVFFQTRELTDTEKEKIQRYFKIRRRSAGGECGPVEKVGANTYRISFLEQEAQQRVLDRKDHVIDLAPGQLCISLTGNYTPEEKKHSTESQRGSPGGNQVKVLKMDYYLLSYLKENPKAQQDLQQHLSELCNSFHIFPEREEIVVERGTAQEGLGQAKWEMQFEDVCFHLMQTYRSHFELDPKKLKILQDKIPLCAENVCMYKDKNLCVVVGEQCEIEKLLQMLETQQIKRQVCHDSIATVVQFTLVEEEFEREMRAMFPLVKISRQGNGTPVFEGPEADLEAACTLLQDLVKKICQRKVQLPHSLLAFLTSSGALQSYQTRFQKSLRSPVILEVAPDLVLSSLTTEALDEAAAALERDLTVETVVLEHAEAESPDLAALKATLNHELQQSNHTTTRVKLSYGTPSQLDSKTDVQLIGFQQDVERLRQVLLNYKHNQADINDFIGLPSSVVVDHFSEVLELLRIQHNNIRIMLFRSPSPTVQFAGQRQLVQEFRKNLTSCLKSLITKDFTVEGPGALQYFKGEGKESIALLERSHNVLVFLLPDQTIASSEACQSTNVISLTPTNVSLLPPDYSKNKIHLEVVLGQLEDEQVDVMIAPMVGKTLKSTRIGKIFAQRAGDQFQHSFNHSRKSLKNLKAGDVLEVESNSALGCQKVLFIECLPWDALKGNSAKTLRCGLKQALELCEQSGFSSVAIPIIGPGVALNIPVKEAAKILTDEISRFGQLGPTVSLSTIRIVIQPNYEDSSEVFREVCRRLNACMVDNNTGQAVFQSFTSDLDEITLTVRGIQLHLVFGDITNETTDVVVNTTDFQNFDSGVCKDILTVAGTEVHKKLQTAQVKRGEIFTSSSGFFPCLEIMHVCGQKDLAVIQDLARDILLLCEKKRYKSVAIPAICAGAGGMDPRLVAKAILNGVKDAMFNSLQYLSTVRFVLIKINVFQEFKTAAPKIMGVPTTPTIPHPLRAQSLIQQIPPQPLKPDLSSLLTSSPTAICRADFTAMGTSAQSVSEACTRLERAYISHCSQHTILPEELARLSQAELQDLVGRVKSLGVQLEPSEAGVVVRGLNEGIKEVMNVMQESLRRQMAERDQKDLFANVVWCIMGQRGDWERFPKDANQKLETKDVNGGVMDAHGCRWSIDLGQMQAAAVGLHCVTRIKRLQNLPDFRVPLYWDTIDAQGALQVNTLETSSTEYDQVKQDFKKTTKKTVLKIERVQNVRLRQAFEVRRQQLEDKNAGVGAGEKMLYHGTTAKACQSIMKNGFNRGFAGQNATRYGVGTYFAVNASYSADPVYACPEADGTQLMFVARVLTGLYTLGKQDMKVPPPVSHQQPDVLFDSLVDDEQKPSMFVVFHDSQAYPDYLITFK